MVHKLEANDDPLQVSLNTCDFFVQASGLPLMLVHRGMVEVLGNAMGQFKAVDNSHDKGFVGFGLLLILPSH